MNDQLRRAAALVAAVLHHKTFNVVGGVSSSKVLATAQAFEQYIDTGRSR